MNEEEIRSEIESLSREEVSLLFYKLEKMKGVLLDDVDVMHKVNLESTEFYRLQREVFGKIGTNAKDFKKNWELYYSLLHEIVPDEAGLKDWSSKLPSKKEELKTSEEKEDLKATEKVEKRKINRPLVALVIGLLLFSVIASSTAGFILGRMFPSVPAAPAEVTPEVTVQTRVVTVVVSATPQPTIETEVPVVPPPETPPPDISEPSPSPTTSISPTTNPPSPVGLTVGDEYKDDRVTLKLDSSWFDPTYASVNFYQWAIAYQFIFTNHSGGDILLRYNSDDFQAVDDSESELEYPCEFRRDFGVYDSFNGPLKNSESHTIDVRCGRKQKFGDDVDQITLTVGDFSSLPPTTWLVEIPR